MENSEEQYDIPLEELELAARRCHERKTLKLKTKLESLINTKAIKISEQTKPKSKK